MGTRTAFLILWTIVGAVLLYLGAQDTFRWRGDSEAIRMGLDWTDSYLPHGIVALLIAVGLLVKHRVGLLISLGGVLVFGLYYVAYLVFGSEGAFHLRVVVPLLFLALVGGTFHFIRRAMTTPVSEKQSGSE
jgi:hypothetical protein